MWPQPVATMVLLGWLCFVWLAAVSADSDTELYKKVGDEVVLKPGSDSVPGTIESILWKNSGHLVADLEDKKIFLYRQFNERGSLNSSTGELTITGLTVNESGVYTVEINGKLSRTSHHLIVISPVPVPTVSISCDDEKTSCILSCDGDTTGAGEINYTWQSDGDESASSKNKNITKEDSSNIKEFSCKLGNKVSQESSQPIANPLVTSTNSDQQGLKISTGLMVFISLLACILMLVFIHRCKAGMWFYQKDAMPWEADFWRKNERQPIDADSNGTTPRVENEPTEEETPMT